nr:TolC family protein [uncultured Desulfuromonas sp.]
MTRHSLRSTMIFITVSSLFLNACTTLTPRTYQQPMPPQAQQWHMPTSPVSATLTSPFWQAFNDPQLTQLIDDVLQHNNDIRSAVLKIRQARLAADLDRSDLFPHPTLNSSTSRSRNLDNNETSRGYSLSGGLNYEVDLWGRVSDQYDSAQLEVAALQEDRLSSMLSLIGTTAQLYWQGLYLQEILSLDGETIDYRQQARDKVAVQYRAGAVSRLELLTSEQEVLDARNTLSSHQNDWRQNRFALSLLLDQEPEEQIVTERKIGQSALPEIDAGIPADILAQRPDLRAAERRLRQSFVDMEVSRKSIYPTLNLTGSLGYSSSRLRDLLDNPLATLAADLTLPLIDWNSSKLTIEQAETAYELQAVTFRQTLLTALQEVEEALSSRQQSYEQEEHLYRTETLSQQKAALYKQRYLSGEDAEQSWLDSEEQSRNAYRSWLENRTGLLNSTLAVYLALGGPWTTDETQSGSR